MGKMKGVKCKVKIVDSTDAEKVLAGQRDATLNRSAATLDATSKDSDGWRENESGFKEWSVDCGGLLIASDVAYDELEEKWTNNEKVNVIIELPSGKTYSGKAVIADFPIEMPYEDLVSYSVSLTGDGALVKATGTASTTSTVGDGNE